jgi:DnaJ-class molecular chaperone
LDFKLPEVLEKQNLYRLLGVENFAAVKEIKRGFCEMALKFHPDRCPDSPELEQRFIMITLAYKILIDPQKRRIYNRKLPAKHGTSVLFGRKEFLHQRKKSPKRFYSQQAHCDHDYSRFVTECRENFFKFLQNPGEIKIPPKVYNKGDMKEDEFEDFVEDCRDDFQNFLRTVPQIKKYPR